MSNATIDTLLDNAKNAEDSASALRYSQAALNVAHVLATLELVSQKEENGEKTAWKK